MTNREMRTPATAVTGAPGVVKPPLDIGLHGPKPPWGSPPVPKIVPSAPAKNRANSSPHGTAVTGAPGVATPSDTLPHGPQLCGFLWVGGAPPVPKTSPSGKAANTANSSPHGTAVTGAPGVVGPSATLVQSFQLPSS